MENYDSYIFLDDQITQKTRFYSDPIDIITVYDSNSIHAAMQKLMHYHGNGYHLAGYLSYELGMHLESKLNVLDQKYLMNHYCILEYLIHFQNTLL
jgi:para-aminobenzoate synthetase/4-amino-4-deoxychorismate lyase